MGDPLVHRVPALGHDPADLGLNAQVGQNPLALLQILWAPGALAGRVEARMFHCAVRIHGAAHHAGGAQLPVLDLAGEQSQRPRPAG